MDFVDFSLMLGFLFDISCSSLSRLARGAREIFDWWEPNPRPDTLIVFVS